jgi:hypothetical protein
MEGCNEKIINEVFLQQICFTAYGKAIDGICQY